jgi:hypothetical protein
MITKLEERQKTNTKEQTHTHTKYKQLFDGIYCSINIALWHNWHTIEKVELVIWTFDDDTMTTTPPSLASSSFTDTVQEGEDL